MDDFHDSDDLYRCIHPDWWIEEERRVSSQAFSYERLSVDWSRYCDPCETSTRLKIDGCGVVSLQVGFVRRPEFHQGLIWDPNPPTDPNNHAHTMIIGKKSKPMAREFAENCLIIIPCKSQD